MHIPVTVVILTYNRCSFLKEAVHSVKLQTVSPQELIILDNCSTDETESEFCMRQDLIYVRNDKNIGTENSYMKAFTLGTAPYILVFHDDDTMASNMLEILYKQISKIPELVFVGSHINFTSKPRSTFIATEREWTFIPTEHDLAVYLWRGASLGFCTILFKRKNVDFSSLDKAKYGKHWDRPFLGGIASKGPVMVTNSKLVDYRTHSGQDSHQKEVNSSIFNLQQYFINVIKSDQVPISFYYYFEERLFGLSIAEKKGIKKQLSRSERLITATLYRIKKTLQFLKEKFFRLAFKP